jgi:hypothetical protein
MHAVGTIQLLLGSAEMMQFRPRLGQNGTAKFCRNLMLGVRAAETNCD